MAASQASLAYTVAVGSKNKAKIAAVQSAIQSVFPDATLTIKGYGAASGVPDQPMGEDETRTGAENRAQGAADAFSAEFGDAPSFAVGLEGGVGEVADPSSPERPRLSCFAWMAIRASESAAPSLPAAARLSCSRSASFMLPPAVSRLMQDSGMELGDADDQIFGRSNSKQEDGTVGILTAGLIDRASYYHHALVLGFVPFLSQNAWLYAPAAAKEAPPSITLNDGAVHPLVGFGTYKCGFVPASSSAPVATASDQIPASEIVASALEVGYRMLDCAQFYGNEAEIGKAISAAECSRDELYVVSKVWNDKIHAGPAAVRAQLLRTLADLQVEQLDLYLVHWPVPGKHVDAYVELQALQAEGLIKSIGVSNYTIEDFEELMADERVSVTPAINQIEINPFLYRRATIEYFEQRGVKMQSYRALGNGNVFDHPTLVPIAEKHGKSTAQVLGRWCVQHGWVYIPKSVKRGRQNENLDVASWALDATDMAALDELTTPDALETFRGLYVKCSVRDTPLAESAVRSQITSN